MHKTIKKGFTFLVDNYGYTYHYEYKKIMNIKYSSKESINIEHNGKTAKFYGDIAGCGFRAVASSMRWFPLNSSPRVTESEKNEFIKAVALRFKDNKDRVFFVDDKGNELKITI